MSWDDVVAERDRLAGAVSGRTELPLLGMTWGTDGTWSARAWGRSAPFVYDRVEIPVVRVAGPDGLAMSFHPQERSAPAPVPAQEATVSVWGERAQEDIARTRVGIIGLGSVGSIVAEALSRVGFSDLVLLDFDHIKVRNLDRTMHATRDDVISETKKVDVAARAITDSHTAAHMTVQPIPATFLSVAGVLAALDCDVLISCVDRPWPRWILNGLAYAHLVPVVDGGILAAVTSAGRPIHMDWRIHTVGPGRACLVCLGALLRSDVGLDRDGLLDDPDYIANLPPSERERYSRRNVFPFSLAVAAPRGAPSRRHDRGEQPRLRHRPAALSGIPRKDGRRGDEEMRAWLRVRGNDSVGHHIGRAVRLRAGSSGRLTSGHAWVACRGLRSVLISNHHLESTGNRGPSWLGGAKSRSMASCHKRNVVKWPCRSVRSDDARIRQSSCGFPDRGEPAGD